MKPQSPEVNSRRALLQQIITGLNSTDPRCQQHPALLPSNINSQPIPYFGDPLTAEFATFGVVPSAAELTWSRWPQANMTVEQLDTRLVEYFKKPVVPPDDWFDGYERPPNTLGADKALNLLGHSYRNDAVHLDLSPRATVSRSTVARQAREKRITKDDYNGFVERFRELVAADTQWFLAVLALCRNVKAAIMAGSITNDPRDYFDRFVEAHLPQSHSLALRQCLGPKGRGATALYALVGPQLNIPVLFVSASPSGDKGVRLASEVQRHLATLRASGF